MSWIPEAPVEILPALRILCAAASERMTAFGLSAYDDLSVPDAPAGTAAVKECMTNLRNRILLLLQNSLNPMQFGEWCDFAPFTTVSANLKEDTVALLTRQLPSLDCDWNSFLFVPPQRICSHEFVKACGALLDQVILWRSPVWKAFGPGALGNDAHLFYRDFAYNGSFDADRWQREGSFSVRIGRNTRTVRYDMIAAWYRNDYLIYATDHYFLNQGPIRFRGNWKMKYEVTCVEEKRDTSTQRREYASETQTVDFHGDSSEALQFPFSRSIVDEILGYGAGNDLSYSYHTLRANITAERKAFLTRENMPEINYIYKD